MQQEINIRQRVLGAIFFVSIAVIVLPFLLSGNGIELIKPNEVEIIIPAEDSLAFKIDSAEYVKKNIDNRIKQLSAKASESAVPKDYPNKNKLKLVAWAIQLATYSNEDNAFDFRDKLVKKTFTAYVEKIKSGNTFLYQVKVGPLPNKPEAVKISKKIATKFKLKPLIVQYP